MENEQGPERIGSEANCSGYAEARSASELNAVFAGNTAGNLAAIESAIGDISLVSRDAWIRITGKNPEAYQKAKSLNRTMFDLGICW